MATNDIGSGRHRLGIATLSFIYALNQLKVPRATAMLYLALLVHDGKWSISALSQILGADRATIRASLRAMEEAGHVEPGWVLTPAGRVRAVFVFKEFWQHVAPQTRDVLSAFVHDTYRRPLHSIVGVLLDLDRATRELKHTYSQSAVAAVLIFLDSKDGWTTSEISRLTGFAYQTVYRELNVLVNLKVAKLQDRKYTITTTGLLWDFRRYFKLMRRLSKRSFFSSVRFAVWSMKNR